RLPKSTLPLRNDSCSGTSKRAELNVTRHQFRSGMIPGDGDNHEASAANEFGNAVLRKGNAARIVPAFVGKVRVRLFGSEVCENRTKPLGSGSFGGNRHDRLGGYEDDSNPIAY